MKIVMDDLITQEQFDALDDGTVVTIIWCGGNGPHDYVVKKDEHGNNRCGGFFIDDVGEHPLTQVKVSNTQSHLLQESSEDDRSELG